MNDLDQVKLLKKLRLKKKFKFFIYMHGENCHFMDNKTFDQVEVSKLIIGEKYKF